MQDLLTTRKELSSGILSFKETDLERTARHSAYGKMNLVQWLNFFLLHEAHHLFTIFKLGAAIKMKVYNRSFLKKQRKGKFFF